MTSPLPHAPIPVLRRLLRRVLGVAIAVAFLGSLVLVAPSAEAASYPRYGQRGSAVRALQKQLIGANLMRAQNNTGYFGKNTAAAIKKLQRRYDIKASGKMGSRTARALRKSVAKMTGPRTWYHAESIGKSREGRNIMAYRAGQAGKPVVMVVAAMHGEEDFGPWVVQGLMEGRKIADVDLWLVPVLNPDGYARDRRWVGNSVDLNRNFPYSWVKRANSGPRAASEPETVVIMKFLSRIQPKWMISIHQPLVGVDIDKVKDPDLSKRLAKAMRMKLRVLNCNGVCHGTMTAWYNNTYPGASVTIEYGSKARSTKTMKTTDANAMLKVLGGRRR